MAETILQFSPAVKATEAEATRWEQSPRLLRTSNTVGEPDRYSADIPFPKKLSTIHCWRSPSTAPEKMNTVVCSISPQDKSESLQLRFEYEKGKNYPVTDNIRWGDFDNDGDIDLAFMLQMHDASRQLYVWHNVTKK
ncbi:MAG: hypothetical protein A3I05_07750 [Deltaproteobacteria bacterium RIFCSPLOWO2_02_FULL_44_10]|nr:MAG: hypothetical protein A3C46_09475 [Deltaproteobacteria bacterium RIFCSPHIGHO2_02_FULL_44_16]OGQ46773.1 MAG: hypothetical protein A3I05_07750 [Deltaproteobacteria bacterium RIFCSPLOWO2_02_FULL_44_10]